MKRQLLVNATFDFDHTQDKMSGATQIDFTRANKLAVKWAKVPKASVTLEKILFDNNEDFKTRMLALYMAGMIRGGTAQVIKIENKRR